MGLCAKCRWATPPGSSTDAANWAAAVGNSWFYNDGAVVRRSSGDSGQHLTQLDPRFQSSAGNAVKPSRKVTPSSGTGEWLRVHIQIVAATIEPVAYGTTFAAGPVGFFISRVCAFSQEGSQPKAPFPLHEVSYETEILLVSCSVVCRLCCSCCRVARCPELSAPQTNSARASGNESLGRWLKRIPITTPQWWTISMLTADR